MLARAGGVQQVCGIAAKLLSIRCTVDGAVTSDEAYHQFTVSQGTNEVLVPRFVRIHAR